MVRSRYACGAVEVRSRYALGTVLVYTVEVRSWCASGSLPVRYVSLTFQRAILYISTCIDTSMFCPYRSIDSGE